MGDRKGDVRVYLISGIFLACTIGGGIFLCMYIILPNSTFARFYLIAGMTLVAIPWFCWLLIYLYRCFDHINAKFDEHHDHGRYHNHDHEDVRTPKHAPTTAVTNSCEKNPINSPVGEDRHVHFGAVIEIDNEGQEHHHEDVANKSQHEYEEEKGNG
ncbi:uncharacterized protein LOC113850658 [Abrus precatorius]|uniref:Uncharacterized protein LOC113850658 n=1 Tax=Abrus precatorius TaxID=3816 RepID=A0A8B8K068_ABRPR|nr:uncharacterized protein LOC113850658 [Abrus precatorius]